jgi:hypothetical protein
VLGEEVLNALGKEIHTALGNYWELHALGKEIYTALGTDPKLREEAVLGLEAALGNAECLHGPYSSSVYTNFVSNLATILDMKNRSYYTVRLSRFESVGVVFWCGRQGLV